MAKSPYETVEQYINSFDGEVREKLIGLRRIIKRSAPMAEEKLSWGAPAYYQNGFLVQFAGCKKHVGFYTSPGTIEAFKEELKSYKTNCKNTTQFPLEEPLPVSLIEGMIQFKIKENQKG